MSEFIFYAAVGFLAAMGTIVWLVMGAFIWVLYVTDRKQ